MVPNMIDFDSSAPEHPAWTDAISLWLLGMNAAGQPATTIRLRRYQLRRLARELAPVGPWDVEPVQLVAWMGRQTWPSNHTRCSFRAGIRRFYAWAVDAGFTMSDPSRALPRVRPPRAVPRPADERAYRHALAAAPERERLMLRLAGELGMRRGEVAVAHGRDLIDTPNGAVLIAHGKGDKLRPLPTPPGLAAIIRRVAAANDGYLFPGQIDGHLSAGHVGKLVARLLPGVWTMHSLRHRFGSALRVVGGDVAAARELLGHEHLNTTQGYYFVGDDGLRELVEAVGRL